MGAPRTSHRSTSARSAKHAVEIERAYAHPHHAEGHRVLVDRLWPRGVKKEALEADEWLRDAAPSDELRRWFAHDPERWGEFEKRYRRELSKGAASDALEHLVDCAKEGPLTLVYAARDEEHNNAVVLKDLIDSRLHAKRAVTSSRRAKA